MKKLIAILGSLTMTVGGATSVVACGQKGDEKNDTGSVFIDHNGELKIDSEALLRWYQEHKGMGMGADIKQMKEFFQLFAVGIMKETQKGDDSLFASIIPSASQHQYAIENLQKTIAEKWGVEHFDEDKDNNPATVWGAARAAFKKKKDDQIKNDGEKNWQKNLVNALAKDFPYVKKDYDSLKKAYINNQVLTGKDSKNSAMTTLTNIFVNYYSQSFSQSPDSKDALTLAFSNNWAQTKIVSLAEEITEYVNNSQNHQENKYLNILNLINATGGSEPNIATKTTKDKWNLNNIAWAKIGDSISLNLIKDLLTRLNSEYSSISDPTLEVGNRIWKGSNDVSNKWFFVKEDGKAIDSTSTFFDLIGNKNYNFYPNADYLNSKPNGDRIFGWLTNSQKFIVDEYFKTQKPVSISEVIFKKSSTGKLEENINGENFINFTSANTTTYTQFYGLYDFLRNYVVQLGAVEEENGESKALESRKGINEPIQGSSQYNFDTIFANIGGNTGKILLNGIKDNQDYYWNSEYYQIKNEPKLLTLSTTTDYSNITKYSVYDFLQKDTFQDSELYNISNIDTKGLDLGNVDNLTQQDIADNLTGQWGFTNPTVASAIGIAIMKVDNTSKEDDKANRLTALKGLYATLNLIEKLNKKVSGKGFENEYSTSDNQANNKVYQVLNAKQGIIAFIDETDGLHITKINGYDILKKAEIGNQASNYYKDREKNYINENRVFARLKDYMDKDVSGNYRYIYQDYSNNIGTTNGAKDNFTSKIISETDLASVTNYGVAYKDLNQSITNEYEKFLVNNSILPGAGQDADGKRRPLYRFNLLKDAISSVTENADSDDKVAINASWLWDYVKNLLELDTNEELLNKFVKFDPDDNLSQDLKKWYQQKIESFTKHTELTSWFAFKSGWNKWNETIDKTKKGNESENKDLPLMKLAYGEADDDGRINDSHLQKIRTMKEFKPFETTTPPDKILEHYSFDIVIGNYTTFVLENKKAGRE